jgi:YjbE family integral membrane protein
MPGRQHEAQLPVWRAPVPSKTFDRNLEQGWVEPVRCPPQAAPAPPRTIARRPAPGFLESLWSCHMEFLSATWWSALLAIVLIDLVLAGDNAIVIALAARNLSPHLRRQTIVWGTVGAIVVRAVMTVGVVWLLRIPGLMLVGGLGLVWIAYKLLADQQAQEQHGPEAATFWGAMKTIVVADALMGIDNVLGVAGAAHGAFDLVIIGLVVSVPIVVYGSSVVLKLVERFPIIIQLGAAVLAFTAARMIVEEPLLAGAFDNAFARWSLYGLVVAGVLGAGSFQARRIASD